MVPPDDAKIFARKLPLDIKEKEVRYIFSKYGTILSADVVMWPVTPSVSLSGSLAPVEVHMGSRRDPLDWHACALVTYTTAEAAATAIRALHNVYRARSSSAEPISVSTVRAAALQPPEPEPPSQPSRDRGPFGSSAEDSGGDKVFAAAPVPAAPSQTAAGFVKSGNTLMAAPLYAPMVQQVAAKSRCKLFVGNLHGDVSRVALTNVFSQWGRVVDIRVMTGKSKFGSACSFIELATPAEAESAMNGLHQTYDARIGSGTVPITVTFFHSQSSGTGRVGHTTAAVVPGPAPGPNSKWSPY